MQLPRQENSWDCGVFVLKYVDMFVHSVDSGLFKVCADPLRYLCSSHLVQLVGNHSV